MADPDQGADGAFQFIGEMDGQLTLLPKDAFDSSLGLGGQEFAEGLGQGEVDVLLADPLLLDRGAVAFLEVLDALLHHVLRGAGAGGDQDRLDPFEPRGVDLGDAVDQVGVRARATSAISARRLLFELFWLPRTSTRSAFGASSRTASWRFWVA